MNLKNTSLCAITATLLANASNVHAGEIEANIALATDYVFRGFSQTDQEPAISGGFDYDFDSGFFLGVWGSNVNFGDNASAEIDLYGGYGLKISDKVAVDFSYVYYLYPGEQDALNYSEFQSSLSVGGFSLGLVYSPDYFGSDADAMVFNGDYSVSLAQNWGLDFHLGYTTVDEDDFFGVGDDNYLDYSVTLSTAAVGVDFALTFYDTDVDDVELADERLVLSMSKSF